MTQSEKLVAVIVLKEITEALLEGAAGPCHYWYIELAGRLAERAVKIMADDYKETP